MSLHLEIPAHSSADNIIVDFRVNILHPNKEVLYSCGPSFSLLKLETISEIQNRIIELISNIDPKAVGIYKYAINAIFNLFLIFLTSLIILILNGKISIIFAILSFVALIITYISYNNWIVTYNKRWNNKVLPVILNYSQNEFKNIYSSIIDIHILYPIKKNNKSSSDWIVIRITNGQLQQPINGPVYWSSNDRFDDNSENSSESEEEIDEDENKDEILDIIVDLFENLVTFHPKCLIIAIVAIVFTVFLLGSLVGIILTFYNKF